MFELELKVRSAIVLVFWIHNSVLHTFFYGRLIRYYLLISDGCKCIFGTNTKLQVGEHD